jgi:hypothetical protein
MLRRALNFLTAMSAMTFFATSVLWGRSYSKSDRILFLHDGQLWEFHCYQGRFSIDNLPQTQMDLVEEQDRWDRASAFSNQWSKTLDKSRAIWQQYEDDSGTVSRWEATYVNVPQIIRDIVNAEQHQWELETAHEREISARLNREL